MLMTDLIAKKRDGGELSTEEINYMIKNYTHGLIPDYQMSAMCMAIVLQGMNDRETLDMTMAMVHSGETLALHPISGIKADKHSTGGVGPAGVWGTPAAPSTSWRASPALSPAFLRKNFTQTSTVTASPSPDRPPIWCLPTRSSTLSGM